MEKNSLLLNEFSLIDTYFKDQSIARSDVIFGIGDDAACVEVPAGHYLLISTDTLVADVHFLSSWDAYDIAWKSVMVNVSDLAAMAAVPCWVSLALTLPELNSHWLTRFSEGLHAALQHYNIALIGGDTTRGPLSITLTIHGLAPKGKQVSRAGAKPGDTIWVSGELGAAALAVKFLQQPLCTPSEFSVLLDKLQHPQPRVDLANILRNFASAAIDVSDGLSADLNHICEESGVGACLFLNDIPVHPLVSKYEKTDFALGGGDDYELCFTVPAHHCVAFKTALMHDNLTCYPIGVIEKEPGLRGSNGEGEIMALAPKGYSHF